MNTHEITDRQRVLYDMDVYQAELEAPENARYLGAMASRIAAAARGLYSDLEGISGADMSFTVPAIANLISEQIMDALQDPDRYYFQSCVDWEMSRPERKVDA